MGIIAMSLWYTGGLLIVGGALMWLAAWLMTVAW